MKDLGFLNSGALLLLPLLLLLGVPILRRIERSIQALHRAIHQVQFTRQHLRIILPGIVLALLCLAIARPYFGKQTSTIRSSGRDIFLLIDVSLSMLARDASPSRMEAAKRKAHDILAYLQGHSAEDRAGIILFAGDAYVYCPLTTDFGVVKEFLQNIGPDLISSRGSSLLRALSVSRDALAESHATSPKLIIISDGEDLESERGKVKDLLTQLKGDSLFLGFGTTTGAPIPLPEGGYLMSRGTIVTTRLNEADLKALFNDPSHRYEAASLLDSDFAPFLVAEHNPISVREGASDDPSREITTYGELGPFLLGTCLFVILIAALSGHRAALFIALFFPFLQPIEARAEAPAFNDSAAYQGLVEYQRGEYDKAYESFQRALKEDNHDPRILQSLGSAAFKLGKWGEAEEHFKSFEQEAHTPTQRFEAPYNIGNALLAQKKYGPAIEAYNRALAHSPGETRAIQNRSIAEALQKEEQKQKSSSSSSSASSSTQDSQSSSSSSVSSQQESQNSEQQSVSSSSASSEQSIPANSSSHESMGSSQQGEESSETSSSSGSAKSDTATSSEGDNSSDDSDSSPAGNASGSPSSSEGGQPQDSTPLSEKEARDWLKALPESPLLMQRLNKQERKLPGGQLW